MLFAFAIYPLFVYLGLSAVLEKRVPYFAHAAYGFTLGTMITRHLGYYLFLRVSTEKPDLRMESELIISYILLSFVYYAVHLEQYPQWIAILIYTGILIHENFYSSQEDGLIHRILLVICFAGQIEFFTTALSNKRQRSALAIWKINALMRWGFLMGILYLDIWSGSAGWWTLGLLVSIIFIFPESSYDDLNVYSLGNGTSLLPGYEIDTRARVTNFELFQVEESIKEETQDPSNAETGESNNDLSNVKMRVLDELMEKSAL